MKSGRIEILLILLVIVGGGYFALQHFMKPAPQVMCGPLQLSPEVKAYIDQKLKDPGATGGDLAPLNARLEEFESKFKTLDPQRYIAANEVVEKRRLFIAGKIREQKLSTQEIVASVRNAELNRFRQETAMTCSGVTKVKTPFAPGTRGRGARTGGPGAQQGAQAPAPQGAAQPQAPANPQNPGAMEDFSPIAPSAPNPNGATGGE